MSVPAEKAQQTFYQTEESRGEEVGAGPALGRRPLTEHSAWDMAFTENKQMPRQLIRVLKASCINAPVAQPRSRTQRGTHACSYKRYGPLHSNYPPIYKAKNPTCTAVLLLLVKLPCSLRDSNWNAASGAAHTIAHSGPRRWHTLLPSGELQIAFE